MAIEREIRGLLSGVEREGVEGSVFEVMRRAVAGSEEVGLAVELPTFSGEGDWAKRGLMVAGCMRVMNRLADDKRALAWIGGEVEKFLGGAVGMLGRKNGAGSGPVGILWTHWVLVLARRKLRLGVDEGLLGGLWERGFKLQGEAGHLHRLDAETLLDGFVYDELCAVHAAFNSARAMGDAGMMERVRRAVRWHVGNTQPDHSTNEPWGLAGFAELDETGTFARQQLHDAAIWLKTEGAEGDVAMGLLADAVMTLEEW